MIKNLTNKQNHRKIFVRENLTLIRRNLWNRVNNELDSFTHKWVKNGKIFVKRRVNDRATRIVSEKDLSRLLVRQGNPREKGSRASNATDSSRYGVNPGNRWPRMRFTNLSENNQSSSRASTSAPAFKQIVPTLRDFFTTRSRNHASSFSQGLGSASYSSVAQRNRT